MFDQIDCLLEITLPFPPTINTYYKKWKNRLVLSPKGRLFKKAIHDTYLPLKNGRKPIEIEIFAYVCLYPPDRRIRDLDNYEKALWDGIQFAQIIKNDSLIKGKWLSWGNDKTDTNFGGKCIVKLYRYIDIEKFILNKSLKK